MKNFLIKLNFCFRTVVVATLLFLVACSHKETSPVTMDRDKDAYTLYKQANTALQQEEYKKAAELFAKVTYEFPYYSLANKAHIMEIYSNYLLKDYDSVIYSVENYIKTHPVSKYTPYTYYMKALAYYDQIELPQRDQSMTEDAKQAFTELISRFPTSSYVKDAKAKLALINDHLAAHEMVVGRYYLKKEEMPAAIERFKDVVSNYSTTSQVEEALYRLVEAYLFLGMTDEARKNAAVLGHNYPKSEWYKESYRLLKAPNKK
jgi:outer membrane protein assembly factor BamD